MRRGFMLEDEGTSMWWAKPVTKRQSNWRQSLTAVIMDCAAGISGPGYPRDAACSGDADFDAQHALRGLGAAGVGRRRARIYAQEDRWWEFGSAIRRMIKARPCSGSQLLTQENLKGTQWTHPVKSNPAANLRREVNKEIATATGLKREHSGGQREYYGLWVHKTAELVVYAIRNGLVNIP